MKRGRKKVYLTNFVSYEMIFVKEILNEIFSVVRFVVFGRLLNTHV